MRSPVQSWVPLQESTAKCCVFFVYRHQAFPKGLDIGVSDAESLLSKRQKWQWTEVSEANEGLMAARIKTSQGFLKRLSWVPCDLTERIRRSPSADWNILGPATWKSSTYEIFVGAFLLLGNFRGTWNFVISFNFQHFHKGPWTRAWTPNPKFWLKFSSFLWAFLPLYRSRFPASPSRAGDRFQTPALLF